MVCIRSDLSQAISVVSKYMANPEKKHWDAIKWILRYLKGTSDVGLLFQKNTDMNVLVGFINSDYASDLDKRRSTSGVLMGNHTACKLIEIGTMKIKMFDGVMRILTNVRYVPTLRKSLISLGTLDENGCSYSGSNGVIKMKKGALIVLKGEKIGSLYKLIGKIITDDATVTFSSDKDATLLWHARLGHINERDGERIKLDAKSVRCIYLGHKFRVKGYKLWNSITQKEAMKSKEKNGWLKAMQEEMFSLQKNQTWELVQLPKGKKLEGFIEASSEKLMCKLKDLCIASSRLQDSGTRDLIPSCWHMTTQRELSSEFEMKDLGSVKKILGMEIQRDRYNGKLWLTQKEYIDKVLVKFNMKEAKVVSTPLAQHFKLSLQQCPSSEKEYQEMLKIPYANVVGCLMYVMVRIRSDLSQAISVKNTDMNVLVGFINSDYASDLDKRISTSGYIFTLGGGPINWKAMLQDIVALSTTEVEYIAVVEAAKEAVWLKGLVKELNIDSKSFRLYCDSQSAICLAKDPVYHARTKHINVRYHKLRKFIANGYIQLVKISTQDNVTNMMTKPLSGVKFKHYLDLAIVRAA
ncbi:uncharacterized protein [Elaeis guineensis]|uniref:uncharacterized protein n=1 Tax=Elaeis guineensis var. tenera TaxID=51953 RepID=UPI003C6CCC68